MTETDNTVTVTATPPEAAIPKPAWLLPTALLQPTKHIKPPGAPEKSSGPIIRPFKSTAKYEE